MLSFVNRFPCITSTLHPLFRVFNLFTKGRLDCRQPLCFSPNAWWKGFLCVKNQHRKMQIFMFLQRLSLESTMHHCPWSHLNYLGLGYRTTQKVGRRTGMKADSTTFRQENRKSAVLLLQTSGRESSLALPQETIFKRTSMYVLVQG